MNAVVPRTLRALLAVLTVWCIGCASFEPMLGSWLDDEGSPNASCMGDESDPASTRGNANLAVNSPPAPAAGVGCGCTDCIAAQPMVVVLAGAPHPAAEAPLAPIPAFVGIAREPQVPPPRA